jgi:hypothetical protein
MEKLTDILLAEIETDDARKLGRVCDIRSAGEPEHGFTHDERDVSVLLYGTSGLLEMLGFKRPKLKGISFGAIQRIVDGKIIVAGEDVPE